jgi:hypothetical protein
MRAAEQVDRPQVEALGSGVTAHQSTRPRFNSERPIGADPGGRFRELMKSFRRTIDSSAATGRLDQFGQHKGRNTELCNVLACLLRRYQGIAIPTGSVSHQRRRALADHSQVFAIKGSPQLAIRHQFLNHNYSLEKVLRRYFRPEAVEAICNWAVPLQESQALSVASRPTRQPGPWCLAPCSRSRLRTPSIRSKKRS